MRWTLWLIFAAAQAYAQTAPPFEVASVKPQPWPLSGGSVGISVHNDTLDAEHVGLYDLVEFAYNLRDDHLSGGPPWAKRGALVNSELFQVIAKTTGNPPPPMEQFRLMLQTLLADRFQLRVHHEPKVLPIYNLVVAEHGPKMKTSADDAKFWMNQDARLNHGHSIRATATHVSMEQFVQNLGGYTGRPLFDHTGLTGFYDFVLEWDGDEVSARTDASVEGVGQIFKVAIEKQLGLKLESGTGQFDTVVIDHAEKPSGN